MNKIFLLLMGLLLSLFGSAEIKKEITVSAGGLYSILTKEDLNTITSLTLNGEIDTSDFKTMKDSMPLLEILDLSGVSIADNKIPNGAFTDKISLKTVTFPKTVTAIGSSAFSWCKGLTGNLSIPKSVKTIGENAFSMCINLSGQLVIPDSVTLIGNGAFSSCKGFSGELIIGNSVISINDYAFYECKGLNGALAIGNSVIRIGDYAFYNCIGLNGVLTLNASLRSIGNYAFDGCFGLIGSLKALSSVGSIGRYAFKNCRGFTGPLTLPKNFGLDIPEGVFYGCKGLSGCLNIPESVRGISTYAFDSCIGLTSLFIPESVNFIGEHAFKGCSNLKQITIKCKEPPFIFSSTFDWLNNSNCNLFVGDSLKYKNAANWSNFSHILLYSYNMSLEIGKGGKVKDNQVTFSNDTVISVFSSTIKVFTIIPDIGYVLDTILFNGQNVKAQVLNQVFSTQAIKDSASLKVKFKLNKSPVAILGLDRSANEGTVVTIDGTGSYDADGNNLIFFWTSPPGIKLNFPYTSGRPTFTAPEVLFDTSLIFSLKVYDGYVYSDPDTIIITVKQVNKKPIAKAGDDRIVNEGDSIILDGSMSYDPDGSHMAFLWLNVGRGGEAFSSNGKIYETVGNMIPNPTFDQGLSFWTGGHGGQITKANIFNSGGFDGGTYIIPTTMSGSESDSSIASGWALEANKTYLFSYYIKSSDSTKAAGDNIYIVTSLANKIGRPETKVLGYGNYDASGVWKRNQYLFTNTTPYTYLQFLARWLDGQYGFDEFLLTEVKEKTDYSYKYNILPDTCLISKTSEKLSFKAPEVTKDTKYTLGLIVNDGEDNSFMDLVTITVKQINKPPVANAGNDQTVFERSTVILDGLASADIDGDSILYNWSAPKGIILNSNTISNPSFSAPGVVTDTSFVIYLIVSDGKYLSFPDSVTITIKKGVSLHNMENDNNIQIYPNPTNKGFQIFGFNGWAMVMLYDLSGKLVQSKMIFENEYVPFTTFNNGIFIVKIITDNGLYRKKLIKK